MSSLQATGARRLLRTRTVCIVSLPELNARNAYGELRQTHLGMKWMDLCGLCELLCRQRQDGAETADDAGISIACLTSVDSRGI